MELTEKMKLEILKLPGKELYDRLNRAFNEGKISKSIMIRSFAFWLNQHKITHDQPFVKYQRKNKETGRVTDIIEKNDGCPQLYWEKYDSELSVQKIINYFEKCWNDNRSVLHKAVEETFEVEE